MLLRHTGYYFLARGVPGLINFLALSVYTHLLAPGEYGRYALALATVGFAYTVIFHWTKSGLQRFLPRYAGREAQLQSTLLAAYLILVVVSGIIGWVIYNFLDEKSWRDLLPVALCLLWVQGWVELDLQLLSSRFKPMRYGIFFATRATLALIIGSVLIFLGWTAAAPLWGMVLGGLVAVIGFSIGEWRGVRPRKSDPALMSELLRYGMPLSATFIFAFVISTSDRYLIAWFMDEKAVGLYSAGYDLAQFSLGSLMMIVNLAAYPIVLRVLEGEGEGAARITLARHGLLLLSIAAPATAGFILIAPNIAGVLLGADYRLGAEPILPWIAAVAFVAGIKGFYFDLAFQLGRHTTGQVWVTMAAGLMNISLNLIWIPTHGLLGAAWASLVAYVAGLFLSIWLGRRYFQLPFFSQDRFLILLATAVMVGGLWLFREYRGGLMLIAQILFGGLVYMGAVIMLNVSNSRIIVTTWLRRLSGF